MVEEIVGTFSSQQDLRSDSVCTGVIKIMTNDGDMFVKIHNRLSRWHPEVYTYKNWIPLLDGSTPKLVGKFNTGQDYGIIMTSIGGKTINEWNITESKHLANAYFQAGVLLRKLHNNFKGQYFGTPKVTGEPLTDTADSNGETYVINSLENFLKQGVDKDLFSEKDKNLVKWCINEATLFKNSIPVPTNWDYSPNNWILNDRGEFIGIIDFENMMWGIDFDSFGVIIERYTQDNPELMQSFLEGYGFENTQESKNKLKIISTKMAIADILYGHTSDFKRAMILGRKLLNRLTGYIEE